MIIGKKSSFPTIVSGAILAFAMVWSLVSAQETAEATDDSTNAEVQLPEPLPSPNPTRRWISPRHDQTPYQQLADEQDCFDRACEQTGWNPYDAYAELVDLGYAVALTREDLEEGLICLAHEGAVTGAVAGDMLGDAETGAEIGAAIAVAHGVVRSNYLYRQDDPEAQRTVSRFERNLRNWDRKFAACLRPKGYRVPSS